MKIKKCSQCPYEGSLWKSSPPLCKSCAMVYNATRKDKVSPTVLNEARKSINKVSDKQSKINSAYKVLREQFLKDHPFCEMGFQLCTRIATDIHHKGIGSNKRKYYNDTSTWVQLCRHCHDTAHDLSAEEQYALGLRIRT